jgi:hypothetical protein
MCPFVLQSHALAVLQGKFPHDVFDITFGPIANIHDKDVIHRVIKERQQQLYSKITTKSAQMTTCLQSSALCCLAGTPSCYWKMSAHLLLWKRSEWLVARERFW